MIYCIVFIFKEFLKKLFSFKKLIFPFNCIISLSVITTIISRFFVRSGFLKDSRTTLCVYIINSIFHLFLFPQASFFYISFFINIYPIILTCTSPRKGCLDFREQSASQKISHRVLYNFLVHSFIHEWCVKGLWFLLNKYSKQNVPMKDDITFFSFNNNHQPKTLRTETRDTIKHAHSTKTQKNAIPSFP